MAKKPAAPAASATPAYDADATYDVRLTRVVKRGPMTYLPRLDHEMRGAMLIRIVEQEGHDAIASADRR